MFKIRLPEVFILVCLTVSGPSAWGDAGDAEFSESRLFKIARSGDSDFTFKARCSVEIAYASDRGTTQEYITIPGSPRSEVSDVAARLNGKRISRGHVFNLPSTSSSLFLTDDRVYVISLPSALKPGDRLSYEYRSEGDDIAYLPVLIIPNRHALKSFVADFLHPPEVTISFEYFFPHGELACTVTHPSRRETVLAFTPHPRAAHLPYSDYNDLLGAVLITVSDRGTAISPTTPVRLERWYSRRSAAGRLSDSVMNDILALGSGDSSAAPRDRLRSMYELVCGTIRYIADFRGGNDFWPHDPAVVWERKYGDCKDHAGLLHALTESGSIPTSLCVVSAQAPLEFHGVAPTLYDHMLCVGRDESGTLFLDPTARYMPFRSLPGDLIGKSAVILDSVNPRVEIITLQDTTVDLAVHIRVPGDSLTHADARIVVRGETMARSLDAWDNQSGVALQQSLDSVIAVNLSNIRLADYSLVAHDLDSATFSARADLSRFIVSSDRRRYFPHVPFNPFAVDILERESDTLPIHFQKPMSVDLYLDFDMPGYRIPDDSLGFSAGGGVDFRVRAGTDDSGRIRLDYRFRRPLTRLRGSYRREFMTFCRTYLDDRQRMFIAEEL